MASTSRISVVVPAHNAAGTVRRALQSVFDQTAPATEIVVVDDASDDATAVIALTFPDVKFVHLPLRQGPAAARNAGIAAATGDWIAFLDADDLWRPQKLEKQSALVRDGVSLVFCASEEFAADGRSLGDTFRGRAISTGPRAWRDLLRRNFIATPTVLAPRQLLLGLGGFNTALAVGEDQDMWIRLALEGLLAYVPETLAEVYVQPTSLSRYGGADQSRHVLPMIRRHLKNQRYRLSGKEIRAILAERYANAGHIALVHGDVVRASGFFARALVTGYRPAVWTGLTPVRQAN